MKTTISADGGAHDDPDMMDVVLAGDGWIRSLVERSGFAVRVMRGSVTAGCELDDLGDVLGIRRAA